MLGNISNWHTIIRGFEISGYVGIRDFGVNEIDWVTVLGDPLEEMGYADWPQDNSDGACAVISAPDGMLVANRCDDKHPYFCELKSGPQC